MAPSKMAANFSNMSFCSSPFNASRFNVSGHAPALGSRMLTNFAIDIGTGEEVTLKRVREDKRRAPDAVEHLHRELVMRDQLDKSGALREPDAKHLW